RDLLVVEVELVGEESQRAPDAERRSFLVVVAVTGHEGPSSLPTVAMAMRLVGPVVLRTIGMVEDVVVAPGAPGGVAHQSFSFSPGRVAPGGDSSRGHHAARSTESYARLPAAVKGWRGAGSKRLSEPPGPDGDRSSRDLPEI